MLTQQHHFANRIMHPQRQQVYKRHMCGLCHALGDDYGLPLRLLTNHEMILLNLLVTAQRQAETAIVFRRCPLNPTRFVTTNQDNGSAFAAAAAIELTHISLTDKIIDSQVPLFGARLGRWAMGRTHRAAMKHLNRFGFDSTSLLNLTNRQQAAEADEAVDAAEPTATVSARLFAKTALLADNPANEAVLARIGEHYGTYLYLADAYRDFPQDMAQGHYNPLRPFCQHDDDLIILNQAGLRWLLDRFTVIQQEIKTAADQLSVYRDQELVIQLLTEPVTYLISELQQQLKQRRVRRYRRWNLRQILQGAFFLSPASLLFYDCDCDCGGTPDCDCGDASCIDLDCISNPCNDESNCLDFSCIRGPGECDNDLLNLACVDCSYCSTDPTCQHNDGCLGDCGSSSSPRTKRRKWSGPDEPLTIDENIDQTPPL